MSASQDKKRRTDERALGTERRQVASQKEAKERKQSKIKWTVGSIIVVLLVAAILIGNSSLFYTARPALQVGDVKYSSAEESISKKWKMTPLLPKILSRWSPWAKFPIRSAMITPPA